MNNNNQERLLLAALDSIDIDVRMSAFAALSSDYLGELYRKAEGIAYYTSTAHDLAHDAYLRAYQHLQHNPRQFSTAHDFMGWYHRILVNLQKDSFRRERPTIELTEDVLTEPPGQRSIRPIENTVEHIVAINESQWFARRGFEGLPSMKWACVLLWLNDLSAYLIADLLKLSKSTVQNWINTSLASIRREGQSQQQMVENKHWDIALPTPSPHLIPGLTLLNHFPAKLSPDSVQSLCRLLSVADIETLLEEYWTMVTLFPLNASSVTINLYLHRRRNIDWNALAGTKIDYVHAVLGVAWQKHAGTHQKMFNIETQTDFGACIVGTLDATYPDRAPLVEIHFDNYHPAGSIAMYKAFDSTFSTYIRKNRSQQRQQFHFKAMPRA